jgi:hypothetical protein
MILTLGFSKSSRGADGSGHVPSLDGFQDGVTQQDLVHVPTGVYFEMLADRHDPLAVCEALFVATNCPDLDEVNRDPLARAVLPALCDAVNPLADRLDHQSLSVGDTVTFDYGVEFHSYECKRVGWVEIPALLPSDAKRLRDAKSQRR